MDYTISLTEEESIAIETLTVVGEDVQTWIQNKISNLAQKQADAIACKYILDKLDNNKRIGFTNKKDLLISAKNEGFIESNFLGETPSSLALK